MIGIPAIRHSDTGPVKKSPYELLYIDYAVQGHSRSSRTVSIISLRALYTDTVKYVKDVPCQNCSNAANR